ELTIADTAASRPNYPQCFRNGERAPGVPGALSRRTAGSEVHVAHAAATARHRRRLLLRLVGDDRLGGEEQRGDRRGVLQRRPGDLGGVDDAFLEHVDVFAGRGVETVPDLETADPLDHDTALEAGVERDLLDRRLERDLD